ncbi:YidH family protein [Rothia koreensis]|jgi:putative membrane protein|uniref:YidH family protein n=1 Tax=Rothia koreensis TaxID=592378 RepID=UPI0037CC8177
MSEEAKDRDWASRAVLPGGSEPDPRFTLANERTFLAWIRTSLAFLAGGIALETIGDGVFPEGVHRALSILVIAIAFLISLGAAVRWWKTENRLRRGKPLTLPLIVPLLSLGGAVAACLILGMVLG